MNKSDQVIIEAPMSFSGATKRIIRLCNVDNTLLRYTYIFTAVLIILPLVYILVLCWYLVFGIFLIPYRLIRRSNRKSKRDSLRHNEILERSSQND